MMIHNRSLNPILLLTYYLVRFLLLTSSVHGRKPLCQILEGIWDDTEGTCTICNVEGVNCVVMDTFTLYMFGDNYCLGEDYTYCGTVECQAGGGITSCTIKVDDFYYQNNTLIMKSTCPPQEKRCYCDELTLNGAECVECNADLTISPKYDCSNVMEGVCYEAGSCSTETSSPTVAPIVLNYSYRSNTTLIENIMKQTLVQASLAASIPIGVFTNTLTADLLTSSYVEDYNLVVPSNLRWSLLMNRTGDFRSLDFSESDKLVDKLQQANLKIQGGDLISGRKGNALTPTDVMIEVRSSDTPESTLIDITDTYFKTIIERYNNQVTEWVVVQDHLKSRTYDNIYFTTLGDDYVRVAFEIAKKYVKDDSVKLIWKETFGNFDLTDAFLSWFISMLRRFKEDGVPITTAGIVADMTERTHRIDKVEEFFNYIVELGYDIELCDVAVPIYHFYDHDDPFQAQADYLHAFIKACLDTNRCIAIQFLGIDDSRNPYDTRNMLDEPSLSALADEEQHRKPGWLAVRQALTDYSNKVASSDHASAAVKANFGFKILSLITFLVTFVI